VDAAGRSAFAEQRETLKQTRSTSLDDSSRNQAMHVQYNVTAGGGRVDAKAIVEAIE